MCTPGKPTVRKAQPSSGTGKAREANAGRRKETGNRARQSDTSVDCPDNRPDTDFMSGPKGSPRGPGESVKQTVTKPPEPMDKLDTPNRGVN